MNKVAIVILADTDGNEALGRLANALYAAKEFQDGGDEIQVILDGAGVKWVAALSEEKHPYHTLFQEVKGCVAGVCEYCANAFKVSESIPEAGLKFASDHEGHPSFRQLVGAGYQVITF